MFAQNRLDSFSDEDLAIDQLNHDDLEATERVRMALIALKERSGYNDEDWAHSLGVSIDMLRLMESGRILDQPSASLFFRAALVCGGDLKVGFGRSGTVKI